MAKLAGKYLYTFDEDGQFTREKADGNGNPLYHGMTAATAIRKDTGHGSGPKGWTDRLWQL